MRAALLAAGEGHRRRSRRPATWLPHRRSIADRPATAADRQPPGTGRPTSCSSAPMTKPSSPAINASPAAASPSVRPAWPPPTSLRPSPASSPRCPPPQGRRTVTVNNGTEFARHPHLHTLGIETFFCDPHVPWQKGGVEHALGRLLRTLPRKTDIATLSAQRVHQLVHGSNRTPRTCWGMRRQRKCLSTKCCT